MTAARWAIAIGAAGVLVAALLPVTPAVGPEEVLRARVIAAVLSAAVAASAALVKAGRRATWMGVALVAAVAGGSLVWRHVTASAACVAVYDGRPTLVGREFTPAGREYASQQPGASPGELLFDAGGAADRLWTASSLASCRFWTGWAGLLATPVLAAAVSALVVARGLRLGTAPTSSPTVTGTAPARPVVYDAFLSYRHVEPDRTYAEDLLAALESRGFRVAIDVRDFVPNQHFLSEMERCIKESRFVLCVISPRYVDSDHCAEEAIISKTLDMAERTRRIVPLLYERVELPVWLHGLVGIDCTEAARVDPLDRIAALLQTPR